MENIHAGLFQSQFISIIHKIDGIFIKDAVIGRDFY